MNVAPREQLGIMYSFTTTISLAFSHTTPLLNTSEPPPFATIQHCLEERAQTACTHSCDLMLLHKLVYPCRTKQGLNSKQGQTTEQHCATDQGNQCAACAYAARGSATRSYAPPSTCPQVFLTPQPNMSTFFGMPFHFFSRCHMTGCCGKQSDPCHDCLQHALYSQIC